MPLTMSGPRVHVCQLMESSVFIDHPSVRNVSQEDVFENGNWKRQVVVDTTLILDASGPDYDTAAVNQLQEKVVEFMKEHAALVDSVVLRHRAEFG